ncbi:MAG: hypothetical protein J6B34_00660 [Clostridia bacterium]|nr:hypothetical protein [Clostridia bacterium]
MRQLFFLAPVFYCDKPVLAPVFYCDKPTLAPVFSCDKPVLAPVFYCDKPILATFFLTTLSCNALSCDTFALERISIMLLKRQSLC